MTDQDDFEQLLATVEAWRGDSNPKLNELVRRIVTAKAAAPSWLGKLLAFPGISKLLMLQLRRVLEMPSAELDVELTRISRLVQALRSDHHDGMSVEVPGHEPVEQRSEHPGRGPEGSNQESVHDVSLQIEPASPVTASAAIEPATDTTPEETTHGT